MKLKKINGILQNSIKFFEFREYVIRNSQKNVFIKS